MVKNLNFISTFFLLLSASFVLPKAIWHDCSDHSHHEEELHVEDGLERISKLEEPCLVCDFEFTTITLSTPPSFSLLDPLSLPKHILAYTGPQLYPSKEITKRGPPPGFET